MFATDRGGGGGAVWIWPKTDDDDYRTYILFSE